MQGNLAKPLLPAVCNLEESCLDCKAKQLALSATELNYTRAEEEAASYLCSGNQGGLGVWSATWSKEERVAESANISDWLEFRI